MHSSAASPSAYDRSAAPIHFAAPLPPQKAASPSPIFSPIPAAVTPSESSPAARAALLLSGFKEQGRTLIATQRPWPQLLDTSALARPVSYGEAISRIRRNVAYFRSNYTLAVVFVLAAGLLWHPVSLIAFAALVAAWFLLYFSRGDQQQPLVLFGRLVDEGTVLGALSVLTILAFIFTDMASNIFGSLVVGLLLVGLHSAFRTTDDLFFDEAEVVGGGLVAGFPIPAQTYVHTVL